MVWLPEEVASALGRFGLVPVVELPEESLAEPLFAALSDAGLAVAEVTLRTPAAMGGLRRVRDAFPEALVGAGTVRTVAEAATALEAGARFIVSPFVDAGIVRYCKERGVLVLPGVCTPTEVHTALGAGAGVLKFFPAAPMGGAATLRALAGPFRGVRFVPSGGITPANLAEYLELPSVLACGGSWMVAPTLLAAGDFARVRHLAAAAVDLVTQARDG